MANIPNLVKRGFITKPDKDAGNYQVSQVNYMGKVCNVEVITPYGLYSNLPTNAIAVIWNVQGQEENRIAIGNTPKTRFKDLKPGEVVVGSPQTLTYAKFKEDGTVIIQGKNNASVTIDMDGNITVDTQGDIAMNATGTLALSSEGNMNIHSDGTIAVTGDQITLNGTGIPLSSDTTVQTN